MTDTRQVLQMMRLGDSAFPVGGFAFSSGLESAVRDGLVCSDTAVAGFVVEQLAGRWHAHDRVLMRSAWMADDPARVDRQAESACVLDTLRTASTRAGIATLGTFAALGVEAAIAYRERVLNGTVGGHLPVAQAICLHGFGLGRTDAEHVCAWQFANGIVSAAVRLGVVGHIQAQYILNEVGVALVDLLDATPPTTPCGFSWFADIATQRTGDGLRLFAS
ncbi:urease accessory protein UreF [Gordonia sp. 852002-51296_SCH5728562-b]|uniref:urease accessory protein UreF n=1 Tax=Gordonia sp. 852002-51296_SCH5728562-b TaxID=1834101 RepID=UPI0007E94656|nr:urease accessory UreF family protein [Gordonia sp. 852002-51296_SCH5728562-b]OBA35707.1 urease accessory protein UreF [Gordonia sp. 852002-51296_SCH5728562-b]